MSGLTTEQIERLVMAGGCAPDPCDECRSDAEVYFPVVAALIAEAVEEARAAVAGEIDQWRTDTRGVPDEWSGIEGYVTALISAARIARGEVSP